MSIYLDGEFLPFQLIYVKEKVVINDLKKAVDVWGRGIPSPLRYEKHKLDKPLELEAGLYGIVLKDNKIGVYYVLKLENGFPDMRADLDLVAERTLV